MDLFCISVHEIGPPQVIGMHFQRKEPIRKLPTFLKVHEFVHFAVTKWRLRSLNAQPQLYSPQ